MKNETTGGTAQRVGQEIGWKGIKEPGAYLSVNTGTLYRLDEKAGFNHDGLTVEGVFNGTEQQFVMLSPRWDAPATELRHIAEESGLKYNF